jgi:ribose/xylose/arabinose/galactoside ABC-type transport system permease subunit
MPPEFEKQTPQTQTTPRVRPQARSDENRSTSTLSIRSGFPRTTVGSVTALASVMVAWLLGVSGLGPALVLTVAIGSLCGAVSGYLVAARHMAPFVATLAMMTIARGCAFIVSKGSPIIIADPRLNNFGSAYWLGVPTPVFVMVVIFGLVAFLLRYTVFGRIVTAIGSSEAAVRLAGIRTGWYKFAVYCISGAFIGNIMNLMNIPDYPQQVVKGLIIIGAVLLQGWRRNSEA